MNRENVLKLLQENMAVIHSHGIKRIGLFGSGARNEITANSDLDFLIEFIPGKKSFDHFMDAKFFLEDLFKRKVDLVLIENLKPVLKNRILEEVIYAA
jgi:uncharacterized protein